MMSGFDVLIVGAGHGGAQTAIALRQAGFLGSIGLLGEEPDLPYERPPLSKDYLLGKRPFDRILLRPPGFWSGRDVTVLTGTRAATIDPVARQVVTDGGDAIGYGSLVWAAGGHARRLTCGGHDLVGVHTVRARTDVDAMRGELGAVERVCIVGGGYVGLEAAAALRQLGKTVTVFEARERVLARVAGEPLSRFYEREHRARGVTVRLDTVVDCIEERHGRVGGVRLADGDIVPCGMVIVGIGIVPAVEPLIAAGADGGDGVVVDGGGRTSLADVYAVGDCAWHRNPHAGGGPVRIESVQNANDMATIVARTIVGEAATYDAVPWFWSTQYDLRLQTVGLSAGHDATVVRGDPATRSFSVVYLRDGRVVALDCVNATRDYVQGRALVERRVEADPATLASIPSLKEIAA